MKPKADKATAVNIATDAQLALTRSNSNTVEKINASVNTAGVDVNLTAAEGLTLHWFRKYHHTEGAGRRERRQREGHFYSGR